MKKNCKKNKTLWLVIALIIVLVLVLCIIKNIPSKSSVTPENKSQKVNHYRGFSIEHNFKDDLCIDDEGCKYIFEIDYPTISYDSNDKELVKIVTDFNNKMKKLYQTTINSKLESDSPCGEFTGSYKYQYASTVLLHIYVDENYFIVADQRGDYDLCADQVTPVQIEPTIYDLKKKRIITQQEFKEALHIDDEVIRKSIENDLKERGEESNSIDYNNVSVFYSGEYGLLVSYLLEGWNQYTVTNVIFE